MSFLAEAADDIRIPDLFRTLGERVWLAGREERLLSELALREHSMVATEATSNSLRNDLHRRVSRSRRPSSNWLRYNRSSWLSRVSSLHTQRR